MAFTHIQCWVLTLDDYGYNIKFKRLKHKEILMHSADCHYPATYSNSMASKVIAPSEQLSIVPLSATKLRTFTSCSTVVA